MKSNTLKNLFKSFALASIVFMASACKGNLVVEVSPVTFNPESGAAVVSGSSVELTTADYANGDITIYYSKKAALTSANYSDASTYKSGVVVKEACTIYAIAVDADGNCSEPTSAEYTISGPSPVTFAIATGADAETEDAIYSGATVTLTSDTGADIYYSTSSAFAASDYASQTKYSDAVTLTGSVNNEITIYAVAVKDGVPSKVVSAVYTIVASYAAVSDTANFADGNISAAITAIGSATSKVTFDAVTISGWVTMINETGNWVVIQDDDSAVELYKVNGISVSKCYIGEYISVSATAGQLYNGLPEITAGTASYDSSKDSNVVYYKNLNGKTDFSGLEDGVMLYGIKANASDYTADYATIYTSNTDKTYAHFGYVTLFKGKVELSVMNSKDASAMTDDVSTLTNTVEPVTTTTTDETAAFSTLTPSATIYYSESTELTATNCSTSGIEYTEAFALPEENTSYYVYAIKDGYNAYSGTATVTVLGANQELVNFADYELTSATDLTGLSSPLTTDNLTFGFSKGTGSNPPAYYTEVRVYNGTTFTVTSTNKAIEKIAFTWTSAPNSADKFAPSTGTYSVTDAAWTGLAKSVTFTAGATLKLTKIVVTYSDAAVYDTDAVYSVSGTVAKNTEVTLTTTETGADIWYSTEKALNKDNYSDGTKYSSPITVDADMTIYTILVSSDGTKVSGGKSVSYTVILGTASKASSIAAGDVIVLYNSKSNVVMSETVGGKGFAGKSATITSDVLSYTDGVALLTVSTVTDETDSTKTYYRFSNGTKYLTSGSTGNSLTFEDLPASGTDYSLWLVETADATTNSFYITNVNAANNSKAQRLEVNYSNFVMYSTNTTDYYKFQFFKAE